MKNTNGFLVISAVHLSLKNYNRKWIKVEKAYNHLKMTRTFKRNTTYPPQLSRASHPGDLCKNLTAQTGGATNLLKT